MMYDNLYFFDEYSRAALRTAKEQTPEERMAEAVLGIAGEAGEIADYYKKHKFQGHELDTAALIGEIGDVLWYLNLLASAIDTPLGHVAQENIAKLKARYPEGFSNEKSINRAENNTDADKRRKLKPNVAPSQRKKLIRSAVKCLKIKLRQYWQRRRGCHNPLRWRNLTVAKWPKGKSQ